MTETDRHHLDHALILWHAWSRASERCAAGYARTAAGFSSYRTSRQYDDANGALDDAADMALARSVDSIISRMGRNHRLALHIEARNLDAPARVWATARIAAEELAAVTEAAKAALFGLMRKAELL